MARVLLLATGPLLAEGTRVMSGQCLRSWHFCAPLLEAGHQVRLLTVPIPETTGGEDEPLLAPAHYEGFAHGRFTRNDEGSLLPALAAEIDSFRPGALVGVNAWPAFLLARLGINLPFWADLNGWTMAEGLARSAVLGSDDDFGHFWRLEAATLLAADRFSTVTGRQLYALQGEMAMIGAFHSRRFAEPVGVTIPNAVHPLFAQVERRAGEPLPWLDLPADSRICLWSGGFNSWTNVEYLVEAMALALEKDARLALVCTGGAVHGHDEQTWERFRALAGERLPAARIRLPGWIELEKVLALHAAAAAGINIDGDNLETRFGARNRLTNMIGAGVPVVTTRGTEIGEWIARHGHGYVVDPARAEEFGLAVADACSDNPSVVGMAHRAREAALREFAAAETVRPLLDWLATPGGPPRSAGADAGSPPARLREWVVGQCGHPRPFQPGGEAPPVPLGKRILRKLKRLLQP